MSLAIPLLLLGLASSPPAAPSELAASSSARPSPDAPAGEANRFLVGAVAGGVGCASVPLLGGLGFLGGALALCPGAALSGGVAAGGAALGLAAAGVPLDGAVLLPVGVAAGVGVTAAVGAAALGLFVAIPLAVLFGPAAIVPILLTWGAIGAGAGVFAAVGGGLATALLAPPPKQPAVARAQ